MLLQIVQPELFGFIGVLIGSVSQAEGKNDTTVIRSQAVGFAKMTLPCVRLLLCKMNIDACQTGLDAGGGALPLFP